MCIIEFYGGGGGRGEHNYRQIDTGNGIKSMHVTRGDKDIFVFFVLRKRERHTHTHTDRQTDTSSTDIMIIAVMRRVRNSISHETGRL